MSTVLSLLAVLVLLASPALAQQDEVETIDLMPEEKAGWGPRNLAAGVTSIVLGPGYWYRDKELLIDTVPANAQLALYYIRSNFQKRYERAQAPVRVVVPRRIHATDKDVVVVRASLDGYLIQEQKFRAYDLPEHVLIELAALPNSLVFLGHTHLGGRTTLTLRTSEEPELSISRPRNGSGFSLALTQTANKLEFPPGTGSGFVEAIHVNQLGEDLVVQVKTDVPGLEVRTKTSFDPIRKEHAYVLDLMPKGQRMLSSAQISREIERVPFRRGDPCEAAFEIALRERLDRQALARAFRPSGGIAEFYQREAMLQLGRLNSGTVETVSGERYRTGSPIELALALQSAADVRDYLALLGAVARSQSDSADFLRALTAPELGGEEFSEIYGSALAARRRCS